MADPSPQGPLPCCDHRWRVHGLSTAYYLTKLGVRDIAVLDKGYLGGGASARTTAIIRSNYLTLEGIPFFDESVKLYEVWPRN